MIFFLKFTSFYKKNSHNHLNNSFSIKK
jgi:hypothetical protein